MVESGKHLALMAHFNHWRELEPDVVGKAIARLQSIGAVVRTQSPLVRHINDEANAWALMWKKQVSLGCYPYYMFVERDTGAKHYFRVPLVKAFEIYRDAMKKVSGLARTARGPVMSAFPWQGHGGRDYRSGRREGFCFILLTSTKSRVVQTPILCQVRC